MDLLKLIEVRPGVRSGKPCFVGTRIAVYDVLEYLAGGMTADQIVHDFPESHRGPRAGGDRVRGRPRTPAGDA